MKRMLLAFAVFGLLHGLAVAAQLQPLGRGDMARLLAERQGRPLALALWSVDCTHCKVTLRQLAKLAQTTPGFELLVVSTDAGGEQKALRAALAAVGLGGRNTWVFGDEAPERLRYEVDPRWGGELPRTYLYDGDGKVSAHSGPLAERTLADWLARNGLAIGKGRRS